MRRHIPALSLLGSLVLLPACASNSDALEEGPPAANESLTAFPAALETTTIEGGARDPSHQTPPARMKSLEVIPLGYASAEELVPVLVELLAAANGHRLADSPRTIAAPDTNAVVVFGSDDERARIKALMKELDVPVRDKSSD